MMQEPANRCREHLRLVAVHPVSGPLDRDQLDPGNRARIAGAYCRLDVVRLGPGHPEHRARVRRFADAPASRPSSVSDSPSNARFICQRQPLTVAAQVLQQEAADARIGHVRARAGDSALARSVQPAQVDGPHARGRRSAKLLISPVDGGGDVDHAEPLDQRRGCRRASIIAILPPIECPTTASGSPLGLLRAAGRRWRRPCPDRRSVVGPARPAVVGQVDQGDPGARR